MHRARGMPVFRSLLMSAWNRSTSRCSRCPPATGSQGPLQARRGRRAERGAVPFRLREGALAPGTGATGAASGGAGRGSETGAVERLGGAVFCAVELQAAKVSPITIALASWGMIRRLKLQTPANDQIISRSFRILASTARTASIFIRFCAMAMATALVVLCA